MDAFIPVFQLNIASRICINKPRVLLDNVNSIFVYFFE